MEHHLAKVGVAGSIPVSRFFFLLFYVTGMEPARGFGLRSAPVGAKRAPLAPSAPSRASFFCVFLCDGDRSLHSVTVGAKRVPLARSAARGFGLRSALFSFHAAFSKIFNLIMMITDLSAIMGHKNSF